MGVSQGDRPSNFEEICHQGKFEQHRYTQEAPQFVDLVESLYVPHAKVYNSTVLLSKEMVPIMRFQATHQTLTKVTLVFNEDVRLHTPKLEHILKYGEVAIMYLPLPLSTKLKRRQTIRFISHLHNLLFRLRCRHRKLNKSEPSAAK